MRRVQKVRLVGLYIIYTELNGNQIEAEGMSADGTARAGQ